MRVLIVDDDPAVRRVVRRSLERATHTVVEAEEPGAAIAAATAAPVDVAVLDLRLPVMSGLELMTRLREVDPTLPVIMLSGSAGEADRVRGLVSGADDYVTKPFSGRELAARVEAAARRRTPPTPTSIDLDGIRIDTASREVFVDSERIELTRKEFDLLSHLATHAGQAFTRAELLRAVWQSSADWQSEATVTEHVRRLRTKIEPDPARPVRLVTVRGVGYRFDATAATPRGRSHPPATGEQAADLTDEPTAVIVGDRVVHANEAAARLVGAADPSEVVGRPFVEYIAPRSIGAAIARQEQALQGHWPRPEIITLRRRDGSEVHTQVASMPVIWEGMPASQVSFWDLSGDTSKLREVATGLRGDVAEAIVLTDAKLRIQSFNAAAEVLYGWREEEVLGRPALEVLPWLRSDVTYEMAREALERTGHWEAEILQRRRDGSAVKVRTASTLLRDRQGDAVGVIAVNRPVRDEVPERLAAGSDDAELVEEIRRGIERQEFTAHFQPVVRLEDGAWLGVEALARWEHPERGLLAPAAFIDAAERSGAIVDLGQQVLEQAVQACDTWRSAGWDLHVAVNLSGRQLVDPLLVDRVASVLGEAELPPGTVQFEVTETSLVEDIRDATGVLHRLVDLGARVAIDDFGTGWASLTYLREFPVHSLKIDRVFVDRLASSIPDVAIVSSVLSLGSELGLSVIAEGIETPEQLDRLLQLGCEVGQGYLFAEPMPLDELLGHRS